MTWKERLVRFRSFWIFPLLALSLLTAADRMESRYQPDDLLWLVPAGVLLWSLIEYGLHRFVFHITVRDPRWRDRLNGSHTVHHGEPANPDKLLVRPGYAIAISTALFFILYTATRDAFAVAGLLSGVWLGFLYYELVHYRVHTSGATRGFIAAQRRAHFYHHYRDNHRAFGVTSPLWDFVFGTARPKKELQTRSR